MLQSFPTSNGYAPTQGPRALPVVLDFSVASEQTIDLYKEEASGIIGFVQSLWIDNSLNTHDLVVLSTITQQKIVVPAYAQGAWPIIAAQTAAFSVSTTPTADLLIRLIFLNVPMAYSQFGPVSVNPTVNVSTLISGSFVDRSGAITTGGASQQLAGANLNRKRLIVENPSTESESIFINFTAPATVNLTTANSFEITPGGYWDSGANAVSLEAVNIVAATTGHKFIAKELQ